LIKHHAVKTYWGSGDKVHAFLTLVLDEGEWSASRPDRFTPCSHWIGGSVGPRAGFMMYETHLVFLV